jgi:site-specific recombinase XerD
MADTSFALARTLTPASPILYQSELDSARAYAEQEKSAATRDAYRRDWRQFSEWCHQRRLEPLPALPETIAAYLAHMADSGLKPASIARKTAALRYAHRLAGHESPTAVESVRAVARGIRRDKGTAPDRKRPIASARSPLPCLWPCCVSARTRYAANVTLLALGFAGAFRRSELCALEIGDLTETADGLTVLIRRSKTDQEGQGQSVAIPRGRLIRPVEALQAWLAAAEINSGPIFRPVFKGQRVMPIALTARSVANIVKGYCEAIGLDPALYAGHSLRAGYITSAAESGAQSFRIADHSRHKSLEMLRTYVRHVEAFRDHSGERFL